MNAPQNRRDFLRRGAIALAGGLLVGDAALEAFERLTHRKVFALGSLSPTPTSPYITTLFRPGDSVALVRGSSGKVVEVGHVRHDLSVEFNSRIATDPADYIILANDTRLWWHGVTGVPLAGART